MFLFSCLCIHTIFHIYAHFIHTYIYIHTFVGDRIFHFAAYCRDCNNVTAHGLQLLCKCSRIIGGFDDRFGNTVYQLSNVRRVILNEKPGTSNSEHDFDIQEIQNKNYDIPFPQILKTVRVLSPEERESQNDVIIRRVNVDTNTVSHYDQVNRYFNTVLETIPEKSSNPIEVVDLTKDDNNEIAVIEHNISIMSISSSSTEQFPNLSN